jgi:hypothetical protein
VQIDLINNKIIIISKFPPNDKAVLAEKEANCTVHHRKKP